jgi:hypothetical protein
MLGATDDAAGEAAAGEASVEESDVIRRMAV